MPWQTHTGDDGRTYYYNPSTNESKWEKPDQLLSPLERALALSQWKEYTAQGGAKYWNNTETGESVWDTPDEIIAIIASIHKPSSTQYISKSTVAPSSTPPSFPDPAAAFNQMLHDHNIDPTSGPWILHLKLLVQDPRYWALQAPLARKLAFDNYRAQLAVARARAKELEQASQLNAMSNALKSKNIPYYARWASYKHSLLQDPVFAYPEEPRLAHYAFNKHVRDLRNKHKDSIATARQARLNALAQLLPSLPISDSRWHDSAKIIAAAIDSVPSLQSSSTTRSDILTTYSAHVRAQDAARNVLRQKEKRAARRRDRKARTAFVSLLTELHSQGAIRASTKWSDLRSRFANDPRYIALCGLPGSTPLELFWDIVEEERRALNLQREQVIDLLTAKRFPLDASFAEFAEFVAQHSHLGIATENLPAIHTEIRDAAAKKRDADRHADERRTRRAQEELRAAIRDLDTCTKWEDVRHHIADLDAYARVGEETAREIFTRIRKEKADKRVSRYEGGVPPLPARQDGQQQYYGNGYYQDRVLDY